MNRILPLGRAGRVLAAGMLALVAWVAVPAERAYAEEIPSCVGQIGPLCGSFKTCAAVPLTEFSICVTTYYYRYGLNPH